MENELKKPSKSNSFSKMLKSTYDINSYKIFLKESFGKTFRYFIFLIFILSVITLVRPIYTMTTGINQLSEVFQENAPNFYFKNGTFKLEGDKPIIYKEGDTIIAIDTSGKTDESILNKYRSGLFVSSSKMVKKDNLAKTETIQLSELKDLEFNKEDVIRLIPYLHLVSPLTCLFFVIGEVILKLSQLVFVALIGLIFVEMHKAKLTYGKCYKLSIYSITAPSLVVAALTLLNIQIPFISFISFIVSCVYLNLSIKRIAEEQSLLESDTILDKEK